MGEIYRIQTLPSVKNFYIWWKFPEEGVRYGSGLLPTDNHTLGTGKDYKSELRSGK